MIAAGANAKALSSYMGHSTITMTLDRYGHLMPGEAVHTQERSDAGQADRGEVDPLRGQTGRRNDALLDVPCPHVRSPQVRAMKEVAAMAKQPPG
jgi:hypothetical protein